MNIMNTLSCHLNSRMLSSLSEINQWHVEKYLNDFVITYLNNILIYSEDLEMHCETCAQDIWEAQEESFVCEKLKTDLKFRKSDF
jgi:hypothetical protein